MSLLLPLSLADAAAPANNSMFGNPIIPFVCMAIIFYFLLIRPQQKKAKELQMLVNSIKTGDKVVTTGGIHGIVSNVKEEGSATLTLKIAENVKIEVDKSAVATVNRDGASAGATPALATPAKA